MAQVDAQGVGARARLRRHDSTGPRAHGTATPPRRRLRAVPHGQSELSTGASSDETNVDAWKKMGQGFVTGAVGGMLAFKDNMGVQLNVNFMYMLPATGVVIEPSLGFVLRALDVARSVRASARTMDTAAGYASAKPVAKRSGANGGRSPNARHDDIERTMRPGYDVPFDTSTRTQTVRAEHAQNPLFSDASAPARRTRRNASSRGSRPSRHRRERSRA